jgi:flagellar basal-body rod protein FlgG
MIRALRTAASGMIAQQMNVDVIANNLANVNTTGFKRSKLEFQDVLYQSLRPAGVSTGGSSLRPVALDVGHGTRPSSTERLFTVGNITPTGNPLDIVIEGNGFFQVLMPDGTAAYTRDGGLKMDAEGSIVTSDGYIVQPEINIPEDATSVSIGTDGMVEVLIVGEDEPQQIGQFELARFVNPAGLKAVGRNLYLQTGASGDPLLSTPGLDGLGTLNQGYLEMSNVEVVEEMVKMIVAQRAFEISSKAVQTSDQMAELANNMKR